MLLRSLLEAEPGFDVIGEASDGSEALRLLERCRPDLLLLDLNMPEMDGYDVLRELQRHSPPVRIIVYTGEDERVARSIVGDIGHFEYVVKGNPMQLLTKLHELAQLEFPAEG